MKRVLMGLFIMLAMAPCLCFGGVDIDISESSFQATGPRTLMGTNVYVSELDDGLYSCTFQWDAEALLWRLTAYTRTGRKGSNDALYYARQLAGNWTFAYTIISVFTDRVCLDTIHTSDPNSEGGYFVSGRNQYGGVVAGCHWPEQGYFMVLDPGSIIDRVYVFTIEGNRVKTGFYQHYSHSSKKWSNTYALSGTKVPLNPIVTTGGVQKNATEFDQPHANFAIGLAAQRAALEEAEGSSMQGSENEGESPLLPFNGHMASAYDLLKAFLSH